MNDFFSKNKNGLIGLVIGVIIALLIISLGFWTTLLVAFFAAIGLLFGKAKDKGLNVVEYIRSIWPFQ